MDATKIFAGLSNRNYRAEKHQVWCGQHLVVIVNDEILITLCIVFIVRILDNRSSNNRISIHTQTQTHPFNGPFFSPGLPGKTNLDFTEARDSEWQWHQLGHMQVCTSLQTDNHASTPPLSFFYRPDALPAAQPTASKHWRQKHWSTKSAYCVALNYPTIKLYNTLPKIW